MAATDLNVRLSFQLKWDFRNLLDLSETIDSDRVRYEHTFTFGDGSGLANVMFHDRVTVGPATTVQSVDIRGVGPDDSFGDIASFKKVRAILFMNRGQRITETPTWVENETDYALIGFDHAQAWNWFFDLANANVKLYAGDMFFFTARTLETETTTDTVKERIQIEYGGGGQQEVEWIIIGS